MIFEEGVRVSTASNETSHGLDDVRSRHPYTPKRRCLQAPIYPLGCITFKLPAFADILPPPDTLHESQTPEADISREITTRP